MDPQADLVAGQSQNARIAGAEHLHRGSAAKAEFFEPLDVLAAADDPADDGGLPRQEPSQEDRPAAGRRRSFCSRGWIEILAWKNRK